LEASLLDPLDVSQHLRVMPLGDSITVGYGGTTGDSYRVDLARYIVEVQQIGTASYVGSQFSPSGYHEGHAGWRIDELTPYVPDWVAAADPDVVLLHAGVNDARAGATADVMAGRMADLLEAVIAAAPATRVIVGDLIPPWNGTENDIASVAAQRFNSLLPAVVAAAGPRVSLARMSAAVSSNLLADGLHPGDTGYRYMAWVWWRCMGRLLSADGVTRAGVDPLPVPVPLSVLCPTD
jgi:lysophospholipase L1-like esterase